MSSYSEFAHIYDRLMEDIPYASYAKWISSLVKDVPSKHVLDLACGTGMLLEELIALGFHVDGLDLSEEMLTVCANRLQTLSVSTTLIHRSMTDLSDLPMYDLIVCAIDSLNYLSSESDVKKTFQEVYEHINDEGMFVFDVHSIYKMDEIFLDSPFVYEDEEIAYFWFTEQGETPHSVDSQLTFFVKEQNSLYRRFEEQHTQRTFTIETYSNWLKEAGFQSIEVFEDFHGTNPSDEAERIHFIAKK